MDDNQNYSDHDPDTEEAPAEKQKESMQENADNIRKFAMDENGKIRANGIHPGINGAAAIAGNSRVLVILGWVSAAFAAFVHPAFAVVGIVLGAILERQSKGRGTAIIITNIVLGAINIALGLFFVTMLRRMMTGY